MNHILYIYASHSDLMEGAFVLRIQSLPRNSRIRSKVARAERMYIPVVAYDPRYLRSSGRKDRRLNVACTHARTYVRASLNTRVSSSALLTCVTVVALQKRTFSMDIFHKVARNMQMDIFWRTSFRSFILSLCTLALLREYSDAIEKVM